MIQLLSFLFLLQTVGSCNKILSSYMPINVGFRNFRVSDAPSIPGTRYLNPVQQDLWLLAIEKHLYYGTLTKDYVEKNEVDVTKPQMMIRGKRCDGTRHQYLIEHVINQRYPTSSFETLLDTGTHVDGMNDYSPIAHILQKVVKYCGTKTRLEDEHQGKDGRERWQKTADNQLTLYQEYLKILFKHNVDLKKEFPEQDGDGEISNKDLGEGAVNALTFLQKARELKKKDDKLIVLDTPFTTIQGMLEQEVEKRKNPPLTPIALNGPTNAVQSSSWFQFNFFKTVVGFGTIAALFLATRWQYPGFFDRLTMHKIPTLLKRY